MPWRYELNAAYQNSLPKGLYACSYLHQRVGVWASGSLLSPLDSASKWPLKIFVESMIVGQLWSWLPLQRLFWAGLVNE